MSASQDDLTFVFTLKGKPLEVAKGGEIELISDIEFASPTSRNMKECSQLKQAFAKAMMDAQDRAGDAAVAEAQAVREEDSSPDIAAEDLMKALAVSSVPLEDVMEVGHKLLVSGVGTVEGLKFNSNLMQQVPLDEVERMVGEYVLFFVLKSFLA